MCSNYELGQSHTVGQRREGHHSHPDLADLQLLSTAAQLAI